MKSEWRALRAVVALVLVCGVLPTAPAAAQAPGRAFWERSDARIEAKESRVEDYRGKRALLLRNGTVWLDGVSFRDGTVEFDLAVPDELGFHGLAFRATDDENYEHIYLRPHLGGLPDATQYTPVHHGVSAWQIYTGPRHSLPIDIEPDRWLRVRVAVRGGRAELSVDGRRLVFPELRRPVEAGAIGLTASISAARFANLVVRADTSVSIGADVDSEVPPAAPVPPGTVREWRISTPFPESRLDPARRLRSGELDDLRWDVLVAGERGIADLATLRPHDPERNTVFAAVTLRARESALVPVRFGFSDRVLVYLNGRPLFRGNDGWRSRDYRFLGTVGQHYELVLPLEAGENELLLAVSESFGGWGVTLSVPESAGVTAGTASGRRLR